LLGGCAFECVHDAIAIDKVRTKPAAESTDVCSRDGHARINKGGNDFRHSPPKHRDASDKNLIWGKDRNRLYVPA
jgi:hypothetical protein